MLGCVRRPNRSPIRETGFAPKRANGILDCYEAHVLGQGHGASRDRVHEPLGKTLFLISHFDGRER